LLSRGFYFPGELPPFSHLGCTLFRHCFHSAQRYAYYHLGQDPPETPQVEFVHLRPYFSAEHGASILSDWMLRPDLAGNESSAFLTAAFAFHRLRARISSRTLSTHIHGDEDSWQALRGQVSSTIPLLGRAMISDLDAVGSRRKRRESQPVDACSSPLTSPWWNRDQVPSLDLAVATVRHRPDNNRPASADRGRGAFRDTWAQMTPLLRSKALELGRHGVAAGHLNDPSDVFFLPWDHLDLLVEPRAPEWLAPTIANNHQEWSSLADSLAPEELLEDRLVGLKLQRRASSLPAALNPLA